MPKLIKKEELKELVKIDLNLLLDDIEVLGFEQESQLYVKPINKLKKVMQKLDA